MLVIFGLVLQSAVGMTTRAAALPSGTATEQCSDQQAVDFVLQTVEQAPDQLVRAVQLGSAQDCIKGQCRGVTCRCPCHGMSAAIFLPPVTPLEPPAADYAAWPARDLASIGVNPPIRPPKI